MGKGYQSTQGKFIDFIADPNFDMHMKLADQEVKEHYAKSSLLNAAPDIQIDYWDEAHKDLVEQKKQAYQDRIEKITKSIYDSEDLSNINKFMPELKSLKRELTQDFTKGDLYNVQKTAENHRKFQEELSKLKDPGRRQAYIEAYENKYLGGERKEAFEYNPLMDSRNIDAEFLKSNFFTKLPERVRSGVTHNPVTGGMMLKKSSTITKKEKERIEQAYKQFVNSDSTIRGYAQESQNVLGEQGWLNENDELDFSEKGRLGQGMRNIGDIMSYTNLTRYDENYIDNPFNFEREQTISKRQNKSVNGLTVTDTLNNEWYDENTIEGRERKAQFEKYKEKWIVGTAGKKWQEEYNSIKDPHQKRAMLMLREKVLQNNKENESGKAYQNILNKYEESSKFGLQNYQEVLDPKSFQLLNKKIDDDSLLIGMEEEEGYVQFINENSPVTKLKDIKEKVKLSSLKNKPYDNPNSPYHGWEVVGIEPIKKSFFPGGNKFNDYTLKGGAGHFKLIFESPNSGGGKSEYDLNEGSDNTTSSKGKYEETITYYAPEMRVNLSIK